MKVLYSQIKKFVPDLKAGPEEVGEILTMTGLMMDSYEKVEYEDEADFLIGLEVRQNRPDCLSVMGVAREVAAYYGLPIKLPAADEIKPGKEELKIGVKAKKYVKRIKAVKLSNLRNQSSPDWLKDFLFFYDMNSVNLLVDLSNYVMLLTGYTSHLIDTTKLEGGLKWEVNEEKKRVFTLDETELELKSGELIIADKQKPVALAGLVGCKSAAIDMLSSDIIAEMAVYDRFIVQQNSRQLSIVTEASNRLSKDMDPGGVDYAFDLLIDLIIKEAGGNAVSLVYDYYPKETEPKTIGFDPALPGKFAGIEIEDEVGMRILKNLRCRVEVKGKKWQVTPPRDRLDLNLPEDLVEEVLRLNRFDKIPKDEVPDQPVVSDITPNVYRLKDKIREYLANNGMDEVLSQPLVAKDINAKTNHWDWRPITTQNSVNDEYPDLRQSLMSGLINQADNYYKKNVSQIHLFEIGKVFGKQAGFKELDSLALWQTGGDLSGLRLKLEGLLRHLGFKDFAYPEFEAAPKLANPHAAFGVEISGKALGVIYKLKPRDSEAAEYFAEIDLDELTKLWLKAKTQATRELSGKLIGLDANLELKNDQAARAKLNQLAEKIGRDKLWSLEIVDRFELKDKVRYTFRATYVNLTDKEAKDLNQKIFKL